MRPLASNAAHASGHINVTPLIDVVMVMIIFFLIVGKLASDQRSQVDLPIAAAKPLQSDPHTLIINVPADRSIILAGEAIPATDLGARLRSALADHPDLLVQIRADRSLAYADIAPIIAACRENRISRVRLATEGAE